MSLDGADAIEDAVGDKYRAEWVNLGLGVSWPSMKRQLMAWGFDATTEAVRQWLRQYSEAPVGKFGGVAAFELAKPDLMRWHHVEGLGKRRIAVLLRNHYGVFADASNLEKWLQAPAQQLEQLQNSIAHHSHACGEAALDLLQKGVEPADVVDRLRRDFLVETTVTKLQAYRRYREQASDYWTVEKLEQQAWEWLYSQVGRGEVLLRPGAQNRLSKDKSLTPIHEAFCARVGIAEELSLIHI